MNILREMFGFKVVIVERRTVFRSRYGPIILDDNAPIIEGDKVYFTKAGFEKFQSKSKKSAPK